MLTKIQSLNRLVSKASRRYSLRLALILPSILQTLLTAGLVSFLSLEHGSIAINNLAYQLRSQVSSRVQDYLKSYLAIPQDINELNAGAVQRATIDLKNDQLLVGRFHNQLEYFEDVNYTMFGSARGEFIGVESLVGGKFQAEIKHELDSGFRAFAMNGPRYEPNQVIEVSPVYDPRSRPWYRAAIRAGQPTWSEIYQPISSAKKTRFSITAVHPIYDPTGKLIGVFGADITLNELSDFLNALSMTQPGSVFIMERNGMLVANSGLYRPFEIHGNQAMRISAINSEDPIIRFATQALVQRFRNLQLIDASEELKLEIGQERYFVQVSQFQDGRGIDWLIVVALPVSDSLAQIELRRQTTVFLCLLITGGAIALSVLSTHRVTRPLILLNTAARDLTQGKWTKTIPIKQMDEVGELTQSFNQMADQLQNSFKMLEETVANRTHKLTQTNLQLKQEIRHNRNTELALRISKRQSEKLLLNILPYSIAEQLKQAPKSIAQQFEEATILFADIVDFTPLATQLEPIQLVELLNEIFSTFDQLIEEYYLEKIKTIGDAYMLVGGVPIYRPDHAESIADVALKMQAAVTQIHRQNGTPFQIRIGINTGSVVAGVIGRKKFAYDLWGDAVNLASRMESSGEPGKIQVTQSTYKRLKHRYKFAERGLVPVKGKGEMLTYWLLGKNEELLTEN
ncbi:MAG: HAMP domain-containing protein [Oscillatoriales cyanobacterium RM2_1_1]|nr:HAMP domain-containing protein [Oscillatoriales cyanobacterium SM2_3_0]NJO46076.1 HAMP domain-containing protein [Oscillatoriales cyanobacterium RM2_1_1]